MIQTTLLIDGNNLAHRCRHVFSLSDAKGVDVSVTYGFLRVLTSLMKKFDATSVMVAWDGGIPEFRRQMVPSYKANRHVDDDPAEMENFYRQIDGLHLIVLPMMGVLSVQRKGCEADDLLYHASRLSNEGRNIVVSGDADLLQTINDNTCVYSPNKESLLHASHVYAEYGIHLKDFVYWRALQGDSSDNIHGVPGIGAKTATKLYKQYEDISTIVNAANGKSPRGKIEGKLGENIRAFGMDALTRNVYIMALYADRVGAKQEILGAAANYKSADATAVKKYLLKRGFVSLMDGSLAKAISKLHCPVFNTVGVRVPVTIAYARRPE